MVIFNIFDWKLICSTKWGSAKILWWNTRDFNQIKQRLESIAYILSGGIIFSSVGKIVEKDRSTPIQTLLSVFHCKDNTDWIKHHIASFVLTAAKFNICFKQGFSCYHFIISVGVLLCHKLLGDLFRFTDFQIVEPEQTSSEPFLNKNCCSLDSLLFQY